MCKAITSVQLAIEVIRLHPRFACAAILSGRTANRLIVPADGEVLLRDWLYQ